MRSRSFAIGVLSLAAIGLVGCMDPYAPPGGNTFGSALAGGVIGAGSGALIGSAFGNPAMGAAVGGGAGLLGGALIGSEYERDRFAYQSPPRRSYYYGDSYYYAPPAPAYYPSRRYYYDYGEPDYYYDYDVD